jgi:hypothetical protein
MRARRERESTAPTSETNPAGQRDESETTPSADSKTRRESTGLLRDLVSLLALLAGIATAVLCLVHLGWWTVGLVVSLVTASSGLLGALRRYGDEPAAPVEHLIEIRHTDEWPTSDE